MEIKNWVEILAIRRSDFFGRIDWFISQSSNGNTSSASQEAHDQQSWRRRQQEVLGGQWSGMVLNDLSHEHIY